MSDNKKQQSGHKEYQNSSKASESAKETRGKQVQANRPNKCSSNQDKKGNRP